jgi:hypothetical protein
VSTWVALSVLPSPLVNVNVPPLAAGAAGGVTVNVAGARTVPVLVVSVTVTKLLTTPGFGAGRVARIVAAGTFRTSEIEKTTNPIGRSNGLI